MGELQFAPDSLAGISKSDTDRLLDRIQWLWDNRTVIVHHPLRYELSGFFKKRFSIYRIVYSYDTKTDNMVICLVGTRDSIYQDATKKLK
jgi:mRNA-degrading endonuclease RelE of RelBE toxin-antitoxin system